MSLKTKALIAIVLAALLWSTAGLSKIVVRELNPYLAAFIRFFIASLVILPLFLKTKRNLVTLFKDLVPMSLFAVCNILFYYVGLTLSTANASTLIYAGSPMLTAVLAHFMIGERLYMQKVLGIIIGFAGILFVTAFSISGTLTGNLLFVCAIVVWSLYTIYSRKAIVQKGYSPLTVTSVFFFTATIIFFVISLFTFKTSYIPVLMKSSTMLLLLHLGLLVSVATYLLYQWAIKHSSATTASFQNYIGPVFSILINTAVLKETITPSFILGTALIMTGVVLANSTGLLREMKEWVAR